MKVILFSLLLIVGLLGLEPLIAQTKKDKKGFVIHGSLYRLEKGKPIYLLRGSDTVANTSSNEGGNFTFQGHVPYEIENYQIIIRSDGNNYLSREFYLVNNEIKISGFIRESPMEISLTVEGVLPTEEFERIKEDRKNFYETDKLILNLEKVKSYIESHKNSLVIPLLISSVLNQVSTEQANLMYGLLTPFVKNSKYGLALTSQLKNTIGNRAPDFSGNTPNGDKLSLKEVLDRGRLTMIDFWASWCAPCREENRNVVKVYQQYHNKGFNILGVSLDSNNEAWQKAIKDDGLLWDHVSDLKGWDSEIGKLYGLRSVPKTILVDAAGTIVAMDLRGETLEKKVAELLGEGKSR